MEKEHAYVVDSGSVYFDVTSFPDYGKLSGNTLDNLREGHRDLETDPRKRHPADFALWKAAGPGRLMKWPSPWGEGFPGWHVECSAMSMKYLGDRFDIHAGGNDLRFPHHEDEIAQSEGAVGHEVVSIWVHGGHLRLSGQKIAKSTGNVVRVSELIEHGLDPLAFRWLTFQTRYRSEMDFTWEAMEDADRRVTQLRRRMAAWAPAATELGEAAKGFDARFREALATDLDLPSAVVIVNELVGSTDVPDGEKYALLATWDHVLGLDLEREAAERMGAHGRDAGADGRARRGSGGEGLRHGRRDARPPGRDGPRGHGYRRRERGSALAISGNRLAYPPNGLPSRSTDRRAASER